MDTRTADKDAPLAGTAQAESLKYLPGLDGLRALAVLAVIVYHADLGIYGGYLGVESFFVISGFLITTILLHDWHTHQRINLKTFWIRRMRRLFPALFVMLSSTLAATALLLPTEFSALTRDTIAAIGYATNWYLFFSGQSYFDAADRPPLLQHLWSLAIEEQFYLLWPLICIVGLRFLRRTGLLVLTIVAAVASTVLMMMIYDPGADPSRIYYGTDTRASGLLIGAALALAWRPRSSSATRRPAFGALLDCTGIVALIIVLIAYVTLHAQSPLLYQGGLSAVALLTAAVIATTVHPTSRLMPWLLEQRPLRWIGLRSYGLYLWHWPVFMLTRPGLDVSSEGWLVQGVRFASVFALAAISYTFVEQPIRNGALTHFWRSIRQARLSHRRMTTPGLAKFNLPERQLAISLTGTAMSWPAHVNEQTKLTTALNNTEHSHASQKLPSDGPIQSPSHGWRGVIASSLLLIGMLYIVASVSLSALRSIVTEHQVLVPAAHTVAATPESVALLPAATAAVTTLSGPTSSSNEGEQARPAVSSQADPLHPTPVATIDPMLAAEFQRILDSTVADRTIPGMVLTVKLSDGTTWTGASGVSDVKGGTPMQPETRVRIGSLSKMLTAVVVLQLVEEQSISLDDSVATWISRDLIPNAERITVRQLLQHTSGLYDYLEDRKFVSEAYREPDRIWEPEELVQYATQFPGLFKPGTPNAWDYSSTNYVVLAMIIERVTGSTFEQQVHQRIFEPLGLQQTYVVPAEDVDGLQAHGYSKNTDQTDVAMSFAFGTANIVTTADDLGTFGDALFSAKLLKPETLQLMQQYVNGKGQYDMPKLEYGLGLMHNQLPIGQTSDPTSRSAGDVIGHIGGFGGFRSALWYAPSTDTLVVLTVNQAAIDPNDLATQVFNTILRYNS